jgi:hypothetical protein
VRGCVGGLVAGWPGLGKNILEKNNIEYIANILANIFYYCSRPWQ